MSSQLGFFQPNPAAQLIALLQQESPALARTSDPVTSHLAAASLTPERLSLTETVVYACFLALGRATDGQLEEWVAETFPKRNYAPSTLRCRRTALYKRGILRKSGVDRERNMIVWEMAK